MKKEILINGTVYIAEPVNRVFNSNLKAGEDYLYLGDITMLNVQTDNNQNGNNMVEERGTWQPEMHNGNVVSTDFSDAFLKQADYLKIGNVCHFNLNVVGFSYDTAGRNNTHITLPFYSDSKFIEASFNLIEGLKTPSEPSDFSFLISDNRLIILRKGQPFSFSFNDNPPPSIRLSGTFIIPNEPVIT